MMDEAAGGLAHEEIKQKLMVAGKILVANGQDDFTRGHISVRVPGEPSLFFMKPHSVGFDEITVENIFTINLAGNVVAGTARRHSEVYIHFGGFQSSLRRALRRPQPPALCSGSIGDRAADGGLQPTERTVSR